MSSKPKSNVSPFEAGKKRLDAPPPSPGLHLPSLMELMRAQGCTELVVTPEGHISIKLHPDSVAKRFDAAPKVDGQNMANHGVPAEATMPKPERDPHDEFLSPEVP